MLLPSSQTIKTKNEKNIIGNEIVNFDVDLIRCSLFEFASERKYLGILPENYRKNLKTPQKPPSCGGATMLDPWFYLNGVKYGMLFLVKADPKKIRLRQVIRSGWGRISSLRGMKFATIFVMGRMSTFDEQRLLEEENKIFGDILQCDFIDSYINLPKKVRSLVSVCMKILLCID